MNVWKASASLISDIKTGLLLRQAMYLPLQQSLPFLICIIYFPLQPFSSHAP